MSMIVTLITHALAFGAGAAVVFVLVHKKPAAAEAAANTLASKVEEAKDVLKEMKKTP
jgi:hypothetical protein